MENKLFIGIDPGEVKGGIGIIDQAGAYVLAERWNRKEPRALYNILNNIVSMVGMVYLEDVNMPQNPAAGIENRFSGASNLLVNLGIWQGWLIALDLPYVLIPPATWQTAVGLFRWKSIQKKNPSAPGPIDRARQFWPAAPLQFQADDGKAVGLLLADFARRDYLQKIDRGAIREQSQTKAKLKKQAIRKAKKAQKDLTSDIGFL